MFDLVGNPKMMVKAYTDSGFKDLFKEIPVLLNPENYTLNYEIEFAKDQAPGTSGSDLNFKSIKPQNLDFEFLFDRTGAIPGSGDVGNHGVHTDIDEFKEITIGFDGSTHRPRYLKLIWGKLIFRCVCTNLNITYKLFRPDGVPLRALAKAQFEEFREAEQRVREENKASPDMTHIRTVKKGDTLPLMTHRIYGNPKYYLEVAKANQITNFRDLEIGQKIFFPPIEK